MTPTETSGLAQQQQIDLDLEAYWMPFTANRRFKAHPRMLVAAEGMYYTTHDGPRILDATSGLWCVCPATRDTRDRRSSTQFEPR